MSERAICRLCGEPMPPGEEMFNFHGYSGPCPKPPLPVPKKYVPDVKAAQEHLQRLFEACGDGSGKLDASWVMTVATKALEALNDGIEAAAKGGAA